LKVLVFGSCNIDYVYSVAHIVAPGETISADSLDIFPGGKGLNQAIAVAKADCPVYFAGCIGNDGLFLRDTLEKNGVDTSYLKVIDEKTGHAIIQVDENGENSIIIFSGSNGCISEEYIDCVLREFSENDIIILQNEINNLDMIIEKANKKKMKIFFNPSPFVERLKKYELKNFSCIILNETEASQWCGSVEKFIETVKNTNTDAVLTLGELGSVFIHDGKTQKYPSFRTDVVDTTAAGDTFSGYFISGLYHNRKTDDIFRTASAAAAISISQKGASCSIPSYDEVKNKIDKMKYNCQEK